MTESKHKAREREDYGGTGKTRTKPDAPPQQGPAPIHRGEDQNEAALADVDSRKNDGRRDRERPS